MRRAVRLGVALTALVGAVTLAGIETGRHWLPGPMALPAGPATIGGPGSPSASLRVPPVTPGAGCSAEQLGVRLEPVSGGSSHGGLLLVLTNRGRRCEVAGYPQLTLFDHGRPVGEARPTPGGYLGGLGNGQHPVVVTLAPGHTASALYEANSGDASCPAFDTIGVTPPGTARSTPIAVPESIYYCDAQIHPLKDTGADPGPRHEVDDDGPLYKAYAAQSGR